MKDAMGVERMSSIAARGLWADDVVVAIHHRTQGAPLSPPERETLEYAANVLNAVRSLFEDPAGISDGVDSPDTVDSAVMACQVLLGDEDLEATETAISEMLSAVTSATGTGIPTDDEMPGLVLASKLFGILGVSQIEESSSVLWTGKDSGQWTVMHST